MLKRKTPLSRSWIKRKPRKPKESLDRDGRYMDLVRSMPCAVGSECYGPVHAHHAGERPGLGIKASDYTCIPLCQKHHSDLHSCCGYFQMTRQELRLWQDRAIVRTSSEILRRKR